LKKHRVGEFITSVPCLYDSKFENKSSEEIYDILYENAEKINLSDLIDKLLDEHLDGEGDADGNDQDSDKPGKGRPKLSAEERQKIKDEIKEAMLAAAQASDAGSIPLGVKRMIQDLTDPKMNWRELLRMQLESTIKSDYTWMKTSRRGWDMDAVMPGMNRTDAIDIAVYIDMSGSIGEAQGKDFLSEVKGIMESFESYKIHIACFDTEVYNPQQYNSENLDLIEEYELAGGGGTDFDCIFRHLKDEQIEPKRLVVFTDGYPCGSWGEPNYCDTVWIIHGDKNPNPPFGTFALYEEDK
jgi:predicted metal-dependent peptidase